MTSTTTTIPLKETPCIASYDTHTCAQMMFVFNAIQNGWSVRKEKDQFVFSKHHRESREVLDRGYLDTFLAANVDVRLISQSRAPAPYTTL